MENSQSNNIASLLRRKKILFSILALLILTPLIMLTIANSQNHSKKAIPKIHPSPTPEDYLSEEEEVKVWGPVRFSEREMKNFSANKQVLPDGSIKYIFIASNPKRADVLITKDGIIVFQRESIFNTTISDFMTYLKKPEHIYHGSIFYGPDADTYVYPEKGSAFVANSKTHTVLENLTFKPVSLQEFKQKYGEDIVEK